MKITCVGGGPAGLYFALLMKLHDPRHDVTILERNAPGTTRGWGVVFWRDLLAELYDADAESAREVDRQAFRWDDQVVEVRGRQVRNTGVRGFGIDRRHLLDILVKRAQGAGVRIEFGHEVAALADLPAADLTVASDGVNSRIRTETGGFGTDSRVGRNKYIWLGTDKVFDSFTFPFVQTDSGWLWAHTYGIDRETSTFIVECSNQTYCSLGFDTMPPRDCLSHLQKIFAHQLDGHTLIGQRGDGTDVQWLSFKTVTNQRWYRGTTVLAGDAAHTTHFTIGSGTKLAIEDAIALARNVGTHDDLQAGLAAYEKERRKRCFSRRARLTSALSGSRTSLATSIWSRSGSSRCCGSAGRRCCRACHRNSIIGCTTRRRRFQCCGKSVTGSGRRRESSTADADEASQGPDRRIAERPRSPRKLHSVVIRLHVNLMHTSDVW